MTRQSTTSKAKQQFAFQYTIIITADKTDNIILSTLIALPKPWRNFLSWSSSSWFSIIWFSQFPLCLSFRYWYFTELPESCHLIPWKTCELPETLDLRGGWQLSESYMLSPKKLWVASSVPRNSQPKCEVGTGCKLQACADLRWLLEIFHR